MIDCDWCGRSMAYLCPVSTGLLVGHGQVWLCECGHESEIIPSQQPVRFWRFGLVNLLRLRAKYPTLMRDYDGP